MAIFRRSIYETRLSTAAKKECLKLMLVNNFPEKAFWASFLIRLLCGIFYATTGYLNLSIDTTPYYACVTWFVNSKNFKLLLCENFLKF